MIYVLRDLSTSTVFRDGKGTFSYKNGDVYVGRFNNDEFNGKGKMSFGSLDAYEGDFIDGRLEGHGVMEYKVRKIMMEIECLRIRKEEFRRMERFTKDRGWIGNGMETGRLPTETVGETEIEMHMSRKLLWAGSSFKI